MVASRWSLLGERRAIALLILGFYTTMFALVALAQGGAWLKCFAALAITYGVGFFALASEWFWARWYAMGLGASGLTLAGLGLVTTGWNWALVIWGGLHALVYLPLLGEKMAHRYEGQEAWRQRYSLDEYGVARLKRAVKGAATALPTMIFYTLAPRQDQVALVGLLALVAVGLFGVVRMRFWGIAVLGGAAAWAGLSSLLGAPCAAQGSWATFNLSICGLFGALALTYAVAPFIRPSIRFLKQDL